MQPDNPTSTALHRLRLGRRGGAIVVGFWVVIAATLVARVAMYEEITAVRVKHQIARLAEFVAQVLGVS